MTPNVEIRHYRRGKLVSEQHIHNTWVYRARVYLAKLVSAHDWPPSAFYQSTERVKYMGLGIGGVHQSPLSTGAPLSSDYPPGSDAQYAAAGHVTDGDGYRHDWPEHPRLTDPNPDPILKPYTNQLIQTMERPVRKTGTAGTDYDSAPGTDVWLLGPPEVWFTHQQPSELTVHASVDGSSDYLLSGYTVVPITEAALFTDAADVNAPYNLLVAYLTFDTILLDANSLVEFIWHVRFAP